MEKKRLINYLQNKSNELRRETLDMCVCAETGHVSSSFSCAEILSSLYFGGILKYNSKDPDWEDRDMFIVSKGQASPIVYVTLANAGFFPKKDLNYFCQKDGKFGVHMQGDIPGVEITAGSLGHGLSIANGIADAAKMDKKNYHTFVLLGDGECYEGSVWEAAMYTTYNRLNNLTAIIDRNSQCVTGFTEDILGLEPFDKKWEAYGWNVKKINGHSCEEILDALSNVKSHRKNKPLMVIANTIKGKGISFMENAMGWHSLAPKGKLAEEAKRQLDKLTIKENKY